MRLLNGEKPEGVVWTADLSYWIAARRQDGSADASWGTEEGYLRLHRDLGVMPYYYYDRFWVGETVYRPPVNLAVESRGNRTVRTLQTPAGALREESAFMPESCCQGVVGHMVRTEADLDVMLCALEHRHLGVRNLEDYEARRELWSRYDGLPCLGLPRSPLSAFCYEWAGIENATYLLLDCPGKVLRALELMEEQQRPVLEAVCGLAPPLVHFPDNLDSQNLTGFYDEFLGPVHRRRLELLHAAGTRCAVHLDGAVRGLLPKLIESGFDAVEALTPQPAGDASVEEIARIAEGSDVILWGGMPGVMFAPPFGRDDVARHVKQVLEVWGRGRFVLGVADQVPPDGDADLCLAIRDLVGER